jgi:hypothetical protein
MHRLTFHDGIWTNSAKLIYRDAIVAEANGQIGSRGWQALAVLAIYGLRGLQAFRFHC